MANAKERESHPSDYFDERSWIYFEIRDKETAQKTIKNLEFLAEDQIKEEEDGLYLFIHNEQVPEVLKALTEKNCAVYQVVREEK